MTLDLDAGTLLVELVHALESDPHLAARLRGALTGSAPADVSPVYLRVPAYAARVGLSTRTGWKLAREGLPCVGSGRSRRVDVRAADAWLRDRQRPDDAIEKRARRDAARRAVG